MNPSIRAFLPLIGLFLPCLTSHAQTLSGSVKGVVLFSDGAPAPFASVVSQTANIQSITNEKGEFHLTKITPGTHKFSFRILGHESSDDSVTIQTGQTVVLNGSLRQTSTELSEVVVTGQSEPMALKNSVYQVRTISAERIKLRGATNIQTILNTELGIRFSNDMALGTNDIELLGLSGQNVKILLDGIPLLDRGAIRESLGQIDVNTIERIEIVEGPMSVIYGTDALAGVINLITKKGMGTRSMTVNARVQEETANTEYSPLKNDGVHNQSLSATWKIRPWQVSAGVTRNNFGGWQGDLTGRAKRWMPKDQLLFNASLGYQNNKMNLWYRFNGTDEDLKSLGNIVTVTSNGETYPNVADKQYTTWRLFHQLQSELTLSRKLAITLTGAYTDYSRKTLSTNTNLNTGRTTLSLDPSAQDKNTFQSLFARGILNYKASRTTTLIAGLEYNLNKTVGPRIQGSPEITDYAVFVTPEFKFLENKINIRPGVRLIKNSVYTAPPAIPSLNAKFSLSAKTDFRIAYAQGYRAPILQELYFSFFDASHSIKGNENLKAESSNSFNAFLNHTVVQKEDLRFNVTLGGFYNHFKDRISEAADPNNPAEWTYFNLYRFKTTGASINSNLNWKSLQSDLGFQWTGIYNQYTEMEGLDLPEFNWTPEINLNLIYRISAIKTSLNLSYKYTGKKPFHELSSSNTLEVQKGETSNFQMADFTINKILGKFLTINGGVRNLFNTTNLTNTSAGSGGAHGGGNSVPMSYGRSYFLGVTWNWQKSQ